jgi:hypothetical protein
MLVFSTPLVNYSAPLTFSLVHLPPPHPTSLCECVQGYLFIQCVTTGGGRVSSCVESIYRSYTLCIWRDSETTKLLYHPKQQPRRGVGLIQINTCRQIPFLRKADI